MDLWTSWLTDVIYFLFFMKLLRWMAPFYHFYLKSYCPQVTYWEQGHKVGLKRRRQNKSSMYYYYN